MAGCILAVLTYIPLFKGLTYFANPGLVDAQQKSPVVLLTTEFAGAGGRFLGTLADAFQQYKPAPEMVPSYKARQFLSKRGVPFEVQPAKPDAPLTLQVGAKSLTGFDDKAYEAAVTDAKMSYALAPGYSGPRVWEGPITPDE